MAETAVQLGKMVEHPNQSQPSQVLGQMNHPVHSLQGETVDRAYAEPGQEEVCQLRDVRGRRRRRGGLLRQPCGAEGDRDGARQRRPNAVVGLPVPLHRVNFVLEVHRASIARSQGLVEN